LDHGTLNSSSESVASGFMPDTGAYPQTPRRYRHPKARRSLSEITADVKDRIADRKMYRPPPSR